MSFMPLVRPAPRADPKRVKQLAPDLATVSPPTSRPRRPAPHTPSTRLAGWAALLVVWVIWGSTYLAIRVADQTIAPFPMAAVRYLTAGLLLYPVAWLGSRRASQSRAKGSLAQWAGMSVVGAMLLAFGNGGVSYAERTLPSGLVALLVTNVPI